MSVPQIKIAFSYDDASNGGAQVFVYGRASEITLSAGIAPNTVELTVPKSEFAKFNGNCNQTGQICLFLSDPAIPDVNLYGWSVMYVEDGLIAMQPGDSMPSVQEKIIGLADRRWEFTGGRGGFITKPKFNAQNADGTYGPPGGPALSSAYLMAVALVNKMTFVSGQPSMGPGDIPEAGPILTTTPYDAVWETPTYRPRSTICWCGAVTRSP